MSHAIQYQVILTEERKALLIIHEAILAEGNEILTILEFIRYSRLRSCFLRWTRHRWECWRSDVEEEMKDKAVLAPTCCIFSSLVTDPSTSKNTLSWFFAVITSYLPGLCQSRSTAWFPRAATPSRTCRPPSWFLARACLSSLPCFWPALSRVSSVGQPGEM